MVSLNDLKGLVFLLLFSVCTALLYNHFSASGIALFGQWDKSKGVVSAKSKDDVVDSSREINDVEIMKTILDQKGCLVVDVRSRDSYIEGHLPGALGLPLNEFDQIIGDFIEKTPAEAKIILYCSGRECTDSHTFAQRLNEFGYVNVSVFPGGVTEWQERGFLVEKGINNVQ